MRKNLEMISAMYFIMLIIAYIFAEDLETRVKIMTMGILLPIILFVIIYILGLLGKSFMKNLEKKYDDFVKRREEKRFQKRKRKLEDFTNNSTYLKGYTYELYHAEKDPKRYFNDDQRLKALNKAGFQCEKCGSTYKLQLDHIYPWRAGGATILENCQVLCKKCNEEKGASLPDNPEDEKWNKYRYAAKEVA